MPDMDLEECLRFLEEYKWVYDFPVTHFIRYKVWEHMPEEVRHSGILYFEDSNDRVFLQWLETLCRASVEELNNIPYGKFQVIHYFHNSTRNGHSVDYM
jgi:hypothetical protein